jgi:hypothetical protein
MAARTLDILGVDLGHRESLMAPGPDNRAGYWENRFIKELDDALLVHLGGSWDQPPVLEPGWEADPSLDDFRERATQLLVETFGSEQDRSTVVAWKDPRLSILLPFWRTVTPVDCTVLVVRAPEEVAASLYLRNGIGGTEAAVLWLRYVLAAVDADPDHLLLDHRTLLEDPAGAAADIAGHVGVRVPDDSDRAAIDAHVDPSLRHHLGTAAETPSDPVIAMASKVWAGGSLDLEAMPPEIRTALAQGKLRPPLDTELLDRSRAKVVELTERLRNRKRAFERVVALQRRADAGSPPDDTRSTPAPHRQDT